MTRSAIIAVAFFQGVLSMGFQLVASRLLAPYFGSTIIVWAFLISTFLAAFSIGSIVGGYISRFGPVGLRRALWAVGLAGVAGYAFTAFLGRPFLAAVEPLFSSDGLGLALACPSLFLVPVATLSTFLPVLTGALDRTGGGGAGLSSGFIYGISTIGNICGVMAVAFLLIPNFPTSRLLVGWLGCFVLCFAAYARILLAGEMASTEDKGR